MKTLKSFIVLAALVLGTKVQAGNTGEIRGTVKSESGEYLFSANVKIYSNGTFLGGAITDFNGVYSYKPLNAGSYDVEISYLNHVTYRLNNVEVSAGEPTYVDAKLKIVTGKEVIITAEWNPPVIDRKFSTIDNIKADQIEVMPDKGSVVGILTNISTVTPTADGKDIYVRGSRRGATAYLIDDQRTLGQANVPSFAIASVALVTGGVPAEYGDLSGGVVVITTKDYVFGMHEKRMMKQDFKNKQAEEE